MYLNTMLILTQRLTKNFVGCQGVQVEEIWSLDAEQFKNLE